MPEPHPREPVWSTASITSEDDRCSGSCATFLLGHLLRVLTDSLSTVLYGVQRTAVPVFPPRTGVGKKKNPRQHPRQGRQRFFSTHFERIVYPLLNAVHTQDCKDLSAPEHTAWSVLGRRVGPTGIVRMSWSNACSEWGRNALEGLVDAGFLARDEVHGSMVSLHAPCVCARTRAHEVTNYNFGSDPSSFGRGIFTAPPGRYNGSSPEGRDDVESMTPTKAARSLAASFRDAALLHAWGQGVGPTNLDALSKNFRTWMDGGISASDINLMIETFFSAKMWTPSVPLWKSFLSQRQNVFSKIARVSADRQGEEHRTDAEFWTDSAPGADVYDEDYWAGT